MRNLEYGNGVGRGPVLVVEDDYDSRTLLSAVLEFEGYQVVSARDGAEAFNVARTHHPALILLDLMMPVMTGEEFRKVQIATPDIRDIPVIVVSASHEACRRARSLRAAGCIEKPVDFDRLLEMVRRHCELEPPARPQ